MRRVITTPASCPTSKASRVHIRHRRPHSHATNASMPAEQTCGGDGVAATARWIAAARALEHERRDGDRMFNDRFARTLAGEEGFQFRGGSAPIAVSRTRFFDDAALAAVEGGEGLYPQP